MGAETLAEALGRLPLALDHAAAYCKRTQMRFGDYAEKASGLIAAAPRGAGYPRSVAATFDLAITQAVAQCQAAETLMAYLAQCAPERIPMTLVEGAIEDEAERMKALAALAEVSLVKHDPFEDGTPAVTVHRLVQAVARARSEANGSAQDAVGRLIARLVAIYPEEGYQASATWPLCSQLTPHLLARRDAGPDAACEVADWPKLLNRAGSYFHGRAAYSQAAQLLRDALAIHEKVLGPEHPDTASSLNVWPSCSTTRATLQGRGRSTSARWQYHEKALGPEHPETATASATRRTCCQATRATLRRRGRSTSARWQYARRRSAPSIPIRREPQQPRPPAPGPGRLCGGAAALSSARWRYTKRRWAPSIPLRQSLNNLAILLQDQGDFAGARPLYERALAIHERVLGPEHPETATSLNNLADCSETSDLAGARAAVPSAHWPLREGARPRPSDHE